MVLPVACANLANLLLARASRRWRWQLRVSRHSEPAEPIPLLIAAGLSGAAISTGYVWKYPQ